ncbi:hypothetical protein ACQKQA_09020 [Pseudomonas sp. NPDC089530]|uniref:hypothetical protein n=1 Tax=Pseudomonas sp. NPDC089530 TaxID=3390651 RepID=UPI003D00C2AD
MGDSAMIVSSDVLTVDDFQRVLNDFSGCVKHMKPPRGVVSDGGADIWLAMLSKDDFNAFYDDEDLLEWQSMLGSAPQTIIEIRLDHTQRSRVMYLDVVLGFAKVWNCILHDVDDSVLSYALICERYKHLVGSL